LFEKLGILKCGALEERPASVIDHENFVSLVDHILMSNGSVCVDEVGLCGALRFLVEPETGEVQLTSAVKKDQGADHILLRLQLSHLL